MMTTAYLPLDLVGGFVHLYHVWAVWGAITGIIFGRAAFKGWKESGGRIRDIPRDALSWATGNMLEAFKDVWRLLKWFIAGLIGLAGRKGKRGFEGIDMYFPNAELSKWPRNQTLLIGISAGGISRFLTAMYWAEKNTAWMSQSTVLIPAIPIMLAILADSNHQLTAWPKRPWIARILLTLGIGWIALGLLGVRYV
jgi:hypothetical protein